MKPVVVIIVEPDPDTDYVTVSLGITVNDYDNCKLYWRPYEQLRLAQELTETMSVEMWALAAVSEHTDAIRAALAARINGGSKTLMHDMHKIKNE